MGSVRSNKQGAAGKGGPGTIYQEDNKMSNKENGKMIAGIVLAAALIAAPLGVYAMNGRGSFSFGGGNDSAVVEDLGIAQSEESQSGSELPELSESAPSQSGSSDQSQSFGGFGGKGQMGSGDQSFGGKGQMGGFGGMNSNAASYAAEPTEIVTSSLTANSAEGLTADYANAQTITMSSENSSVKISSSGTYIITGSCEDGNITVKKGTTGVVLILKDLDLTSSTGATLSINKGTEVKVLVEGSVSLTDAENLADEELDSFDGAVIKVKSGASTVIGGSGTLTVNGSCKNGIKVSDLDEDDIADGYSEASLIIDGDLTINVTAANDGISSGTDLTIKSGNITVSAADDGIKADYILTIGEEGSEGPTINVTQSEEGLEGATINIYSGNITVNASDDGINAANSDLTDYTYSLNIMGGTVNVSSGADGIDSNGNINILGGLTTIVKSASNGGEGGIDYEGSCYVADGCLVNPYGVTMDSGNGGQGGNGGFSGAGGWKNRQNSGSDLPQQPDGNSNSEMPQMPEWNGQNGQMPQMPEWNNQNGQDGQPPQLPEWNNQNGQDGQQQRPGRGQGRPGQMQGPGMNNQMPGQNGQAPEMPQFPGSTQNQ